MRDAALECPVSGGDMKAKTIVLTVAVCFVAAVCFASDDAFTGTRKLNEAKSKLAGGPKNNLVVYEAAGDNVKITVDGTDSDGKPTHNEWTRSEEHTSELQSPCNLVCRLLLEKKKKQNNTTDS